MVVVAAPERQHLAGFGEGYEDLLVQAFVPKAAVEALDEGVLLRPAGINVVPFDAVVLCPFQDGLARELRAVCRTVIGYGAPFQDGLARELRAVAPRGGRVTHLFQDGLARELRAVVGDDTVGLSVEPHQRIQFSPVDFTVIEGLRTAVRQAQLVQSGASLMMNSRHLSGHAVDLLPINPVTGRGEWAWPLCHQLTAAVKRAALEENVKIVWGGDWTTFRDGPHFELDRTAYPADAWHPTASPPKQRTSVARTGTAKAVAVGAMSAVGTVGTAVSSLDGEAQTLALLPGFVTLLAFAWIFRARLRRWAEGDR